MHLINAIRLGFVSWIVVTVRHTVFCKGCASEVSSLILLSPPLTNVLIPTSCVAFSVSVCGSSLNCSSPTTGLSSEILWVECTANRSREPARVVNIKQNEARDTTRTMTQASMSCQKTNQMPLTGCFEWTSKAYRKLKEPQIIMVERLMERLRASFRSMSFWIRDAKYMGIGKTKKRQKSAWVTEW